MSEEAKISYKLLDSFVVDPGTGHKDTVRQVYFRAGDKAKSEVDKVMVLDWWAGPHAGPDDVGVVMEEVKKEGTRETKD